MSENSFKSIRNGVIASVIGGIILWVIFGGFSAIREYAVSFLFWLWSGVVWCWEALIASYSLQGWILLLISIFALIGLISIVYSLYISLKEHKYPEFRSYTEDFMHGVKWRWSWSGNQISNVCCYCPCCDAMLVYIDKHTRNDMFYDKTDFICEHCNHNVVTSIVGDKNYVIALIKREIDRRIRTDEYKK